MRYNGSGNQLYIHGRHPLLLPPEAIDGWDTRLPKDARTITPEFFTQAFPDGMDLIITSPPMLPRHLHGHTGDSAISPSHSRPDKKPNPSPRCDPRGRNRICLGHPRRILSTRTRPTNDWTVYSPKRPQMRIGSTPPHPLMAKTPTQGGTRRGLLETA